MTNMVERPWTQGPDAACQARPFPEAIRTMPIAAQYGLAVVLVTGATVVAFLTDQLVAAPSLTLIFVLPVVIVATSFSWGPSLGTVLASVASFDFFFTRPYFTLRMTEPAEIWTAALLLVTAAIVSTVAGQSRRRAVEARRAADQARALQGLAHVIIDGLSRKDILQAAASALSRIFQAAAVIYAESEGRLELEAKAGGAVLSDAEAEAAAGALEAQAHLRGEAYPYDRSRFDFWPVATPAGGRFVIGIDFRTSEIERPQSAERFVEIVAAYLAASLKPART